ncbi:unnamed protein product [Dovyalis caffra]|uniref:Uncharacterized protein n=1 Tax=Dovyalis caffra TaxID=77055 RepID=A0AAV1SW19_9ROSI|nr:unnamed protein product [Dovyalis caffra]
MPFGDSYHHHEMNSTFKEGVKKVATRYDKGLRHNSYGTGPSCRVELITIGRPRLPCMGANFSGSVYYYGHASTYNAPWKDHSVSLLQIKAEGDGYKSQKALVEAHGEVNYSIAILERIQKNNQEQETSKIAEEINRISIGCGAFLVCHGDHPTGALQKQFPSWVEPSRAEPNGAETIIAAGLQE